MRSSDPASGSSAPCADVANELEYPERLGDDATQAEASEAVDHAQAIITAAEGLNDRLGLF